MVIVTNLDKKDNVVGDQTLAIFDQRSIIKEYYPNNPPL